MSKRLTTEEFISRAKKIHGDKYDYSKVKYVNMFTKVCIICPEHGEFLQKPVSHLNGHKCYFCGLNSLKSKVYGIGINDVFESKHLKSHQVWVGMLERCYNDKTRHLYKSYYDCTVCESWIYFSNFKKWFDEHYVEGFALDKDILVKGNRIYSPDTCCFVPQEINNVVQRREISRGSTLIGVYKKGRKYSADIGGKYGIHVGTFCSQIEAFQAYKAVKEKIIKDLAYKYKNKIEPRVYEALYNYEVEITD